MAEQNSIIYKVERVIETYKGLKSLFDGIKQELGGRLEIIKRDIESLDTTVEKALGSGNIDQVMDYIKEAASHIPTKYQPNLPTRVSSREEPKLKVGEGYIKTAVQHYTIVEHPIQRYFTVQEIIGYIKPKIPSGRRVSAAAIAQAFRGLKFKKSKKGFQRTSR